MRTETFREYSLYFTSNVPLKWSGIRSFTWYHLPADLISTVGLLTWTDKIQTGAGIRIGFLR
jgi:hypothetical protein